MTIVKALCVFGTRPEAIKMAPVVHALQDDHRFDVEVCVTAQHRDMLDQVLNLFDITPNYDLDLMAPDQSLTNLTASVLKGLDHVLADCEPDVVLVHGDTITCFAATLAAYFKKIPTAHVEAGLRTSNLYSPWPEEGNRRLTGSIAALHFASTAMAKANLMKEGIEPESVIVTGNTVVDALLSVTEKLNSSPALVSQCEKDFPFLRVNSKLILITGHRRESFGAGFERICRAIRKLAIGHPEIDLVYPVHLNPNVREAVWRLLSDLNNVHLIEPIRYASFVYLMARAHSDIHFVEPELDMVVSAAVSNGYLRANTTPEPADAFLIAVPTPLKETNAPDLTYVETATRSIAQVLQPGNLVILESTSPVGTTQRIAKWLAEERPDLVFPEEKPNQPDIHIAHCPERVLPGQVLTELINNDRVIGGLTPACSEKAIELYRTFVDAEMLVTNAQTAEMCKLVENSFRDVNIAFANELSMICSDTDINIWELISLANHHPRVNILQPGTGVGGHCIAVDPWFIVSQAKEQSRLIQAARGVNDLKPSFVAQQIITAARTANTTNVTCMGLAFKPNIDDLRESPAIEVIRILVDEGMEVCVVEPNIQQLPQSLSATNCSLIALGDIDGATKLQRSL